MFFEDVFCYTYLDHRETKPFLKIFQDLKFATDINPSVRWMSPIPVSQALSDLHSRIRPVPRAYILRQDPLFAGSNSHPHWHRAIRPRSRTTQSILYAKSVSSAPAISNSLSIAEPLAPRTHQSHKFSHHHPHLTSAAILQINVIVTEDCVSVSRRAEKDNFLISLLLNIRHQCL